VSDNIRTLALSVPCPICRAARGVDCSAPQTRTGFHVNRADRGIVAGYRGEARQHTRAMQALGRVRAAGRRAKDAYVTTALACACGECLRGNVELARELVALGVLDLGAQ
jgi:hypothetical protein